MQEVRGSIPLGSTNEMNYSAAFFTARQAPIDSASVDPAP
jgi:hypothetical protein